MLDFFETTPVKPEALSRRALVFPRGVHALLLRVISVCVPTCGCVVLAYACTCAARLLYPVTHHVVRRVQAQ